MNIVEYKKNCPECGLEITYKQKRYLDDSLLKNKKCRWCCNVIRGKSSNRKGIFHNENSKLAISLAHKGKKLSVETKQRMSNFQKTRYSNENERKKMSVRITNAMHRPDVRKKHIESLHQSKWIKVKTDKGQLELLDKWNKLGFNFEPNYKIKTDIDLFYIDGYDKNKNVVLEYDSKYHKPLNQMEKDLIRQRKIIDILHPKKFWKYDSETKTVKNILKD